MSGVDEHELFARLDISAPGAFRWSDHENWCVWVNGGVVCDPLGGVIYDEAGEKLHEDALVYAAAALRERSLRALLDDLGVPLSDHSDAVRVAWVVGRYGAAGGGR